jgi:hypothetical protein
MYGLQANSDVMQGKWSIHQDGKALAMHVGSFFVNNSNIFKAH